MRLSRRYWLFVLAAVLLPLLGPPVEAAWQCRGGLCGFRLWACCCVAAAQTAEPAAGRTLAVRRPACPRCGQTCRCRLLTNSTEGVKNGGDAGAKSRLPAAALTAAIPAWAPPAVVTPRWRIKAPMRAVVCDRPCSLRAPPSACV